MWQVFGWTAGFAAVSGFLRELQKLLVRGKLTRRDGLKLALDTAVIAFWGGLTGWALNPAVPIFADELLAVLAALGGWFGRHFLQGIIMRALGLNKLFRKLFELTEEPPPRTMPRYNTPPIDVDRPDL